MQTTALKFFPHIDPQEVWSAKKWARVCQFTSFCLAQCGPSKKRFVFVLPCISQSGQGVVIRRPEWNSCLALLTAVHLRLFYAFENAMFCLLCRTHCLLMISGSYPTVPRILTHNTVLAFASGPRLWRLEDLPGKCLSAAVETFWA